MTEEQAITRLKQAIDDSQICSEATRELRAEIQLSDRLHEGTLLTVLEWAGEPEMTLSKLRSIIYKYLTLKNTHTK